MTFGVGYYSNIANTYPACIATSLLTANLNVVYYTCTCMYTEFTNWHFSLVDSHNGDWLSAFGTPSQLQSSYLVVGPYSEVAGLHL